MRRVTWADGLVRMASEATDALDPALARTGHRDERNTVVLHHDVDPHGALGPGQLEHGPTVPDSVARFLSCDARVQVMTYRQGRLIGINPAERTPNRATRRYLARRDQGCTHPLCTQKLWLHAHHIKHWTDDGPTSPENLTLLCPTTTAPSTSATSASKATPKREHSASSTCSGYPSPHPASTPHRNHHHDTGLTGRTPHRSANA